MSELGGRDEPQSDRQFGPTNSVRLAGRGAEERQPITYPVWKVHDSVTSENRGWESQIKWNERWLGQLLLVGIMNRR